MFLQNRALTRNAAFPTEKKVTTPADEMLMKKVGRGGKVFYLYRSRSTASEQTRWSHF
jgi:hypothetical protein